LVPEARYDGIADWYEEWAGGYVRPFAPVLAARVVEFVKPDSTVIDVGCGTGLHFDAFQALNLHPIGVDVSVDQLRLARKRSVVVRADAAALPVRNEAIDAAVAAFVHRDVDDFAGAVAEVARVLRPGSRFVSVGTHPCFVAPFINRTKERNIRKIEVRRGYGDTERRFDSAAPSRLATTVGSRNLALAAFLHAFIGAGLRIESLVELDTEARPWVAEPDDQTILPWNILVVAAKS
jgi:SAM-dependent methyltransferase